MRGRVLISGASVAGPVTAYWLSRHGFDVTVVERADELRLGGQNIDISDAAREVIRRMDLEDDVRSRHTGERGLQFVDTDNRPKASFPVASKGSLTKEIEIVRGDLVDILAGATGDRVDYRFGDYIIALEEDGDGVLVSFARGESETFDLVIAADGMNSSTRKMVVGDGDHEDYLGCWAAYFTLPRKDGDNDWWRWYTSPTGVIAFLRPDNDGTMRAQVNFLSDRQDASHMSLNEKRRILREQLRGAGWECDRMAAALDDADDVFLGPLHQVKATRWHRGRTAIVGDAAYCPTPYTGMGTTLAIIGAYVLANELAIHEHYPDAFRSYEERVRPFVEKSQKLPPGVPKAAYANSRLKVALINNGAALAASAPVQKLISLFGGDDSDTNEFDLPNYPTTEQTRAPLRRSA